MDDSDASLLVCGDSFIIAGLRKGGGAFKREFVQQGTNFGKEGIDSRSRADRFPE